MLIKIVIDGDDLESLADFWCAALEYERLPMWDPSYLNLRPVSGGASAGGPPLLLQRVPEPKGGKNRLHLDLHPDDGPATVEALEALGGRPIGPPSTEYLAQHGTVFQVMADPEGNEFCVIWRTAPVPWDQ